MSENKIFEDMPDDEYFGLPNRMSASTLKCGAKTAAHMLHQIETPFDGNDATRFGNAYHLRCLKPDLYDEEVTFFPGARRQGKEWEKFKEESEGKVIITKSDAAQIEAMFEVLEQNEVAMGILSSEMLEVVACWTDPKSGVLCKSKLDCVQPGEYIADLKTTADASPFKFKNSMKDYGYYVQAPFYQRAWEVCRGETLPFIFVCQEKTPPYLVAMYEISKEAMEFGHGEVDRLLSLYVACTETGVWPGYSPEIETIGVPEYMLKGD